MDDGKSTKKAEAAEAPVKGKGGKKGARKDAAPKETKPAREPRPRREKVEAEPMVVFAIRVPESERNALHEMAGSGKSTRLVRALIAAAIAADTEAFKKLASRATAK